MQRLFSPPNIFTNNNLSSIFFVSKNQSSLSGKIDLLVAPIVPITEASLFQEDPVVSLIFSFICY